MPFTTEDIKNIGRPFTKDQIKERPGKAGQTWKYVPADSIIERLNETLGFSWSFDILSQQTISDPPITIITDKVIETDDAGRIIKSEKTERIKQKFLSCVVLGKLTVYDPENGTQYSKSHVGSMPVKYKDKEPEVLVDIGNDMKSAASDAIKKCAESLGIALNLTPQEPKCTDGQIRILIEAFKAIGKKVTEDELIGLTAKEAEELITDLTK